MLITTRKVLLALFLTLVVFADNSFAACEKYSNSDIVNVKKFGATGDGKSDDTLAIQEALSCSSQLKIPVFLPSGNYLITKALTVYDDSYVYGSGVKTRLLVKSDVGITTSSTQSSDNITIRDLSLEYIHPKPDNNHKALLLRNHNSTLLERMWFFNFSNQIICEISPEYIDKANRNVTFNTYKNWFVDECRIGVVYNGSGETSSKGPLSVISNNSWYDITFRRVKESAVLAKRWVDSERWYNLYAQAITPTAILVNLNESSSKWEQVDRFTFYSPCLVYDPKLKNTSQNIYAVRFGKGTFKHFFYGMISDKVWGSGMIKDDGAISYYITGDYGRGYNAGPAIITKGLEADASLSKPVTGKPEDE